MNCPTCGLEVSNGIENIIYKTHHHEFYHKECVDKAPVTEQGGYKLIRNYPQYVYNA